MKHLSHLLLIGILICAAMVGGVQALDPVISNNSQTSNSGSGGYNQCALNDYPGWEAYKVFDGDTSDSSRWYSNSAIPQWIQQYIPGNTIATAYKIYPTTAGETYSPFNFTFSGSNNNITFTTLDTQTFQQNWIGLPRTFSFSNTNPYSFYRLNITQINITPGTSETLNEIYIYGISSPKASFTPVTSTGIPPLAVTFTDTSSGSPTNWNWAIQGYGTNTSTYATASTVQNPSFTFLTGNFTVILSATNAGGTGVSAQNSWVNVSATPTYTDPLGYILANGVNNKINFYNFLAATDGQSIQILVSGSYEVA